MSILPPDRLVGMAIGQRSHRTAWDPFYDVGQRRLGLLGHSVGGGHAGPHAETQPVHRVQVPLDDAERQPGFFPQRGDQADQVDPQTLFAQHHALQLRWRHTAAPAAWAGASDVGVFGDCHRHLGQIDDFPGDDLPGVVGPAAGQLGSAVGTPLHHMLHPMGGGHAGAGEAMRPTLAWFPGLGWLAINLGLQTGHPTRAFGFGLPFQLGNPLLQLIDHRLLPDEEVPLLSNNARSASRSKVVRSISLGTPDT